MRRSASLAVAACLLLSGPAVAGDMSPGRAGAAQAAAFLRFVPPHAVADTLEMAQACCKLCRKGKACGDACIARTKTCTKPPGCACNAQ